MSPKSTLLLGIVLLVLAVSCSALTDKVAEWSGVIDDGNSRTVALSKGIYGLEMTASGDGASVEWLGGNCPGSGPAKTYKGVCELTQSGQLIVKNPSTFGLGSSSSVTILITEIDR
ncbi:MAG: hypothetical protein BZY75_01865 [SAR202 cluster bacterium Io17-Chloro-G7]|nr:MAG: hypothetical protein BZY75_01865 [SAR202 cluster bacterium Io17-Chloro-G7]